MSEAGNRWHIWKTLTGRAVAPEPTVSSESVPANPLPPLEHGGAYSSAASTLWGAVTGITIFALGLFIFHGLMNRPSQQILKSDLYIHTATVMNKHVVTNPLKIAYPLYHYSVGAIWPLIPPGENHWEEVRQAAAIVLAFAFGVRGWLSFRELRGSMPARTAFAICLLLAVAMALPNWWRKPADYIDRIAPGVWWKEFPSIYLGVINPNVWHNPTAIFAAPFALLLFHQATQYLEKPGLQAAVAVGIASVLCTLAKPNYLLAFLPGFGVVLLLEMLRAVREGGLPVRRALLYSLAVFVLPVGALVFQFLYTFGGDNQVVFRPFAAWGVFVDSPPDHLLYWIRPDVLAVRIPAAILLGTAFPVAVFACYPHQVRRDVRSLFAWLVVAVAIAQYALFAETQQLISGNFFWALVPASYILFLESCRIVGRQPQSLRRVSCFGVLLLHAGCGVICVTRALMDPGNSLLF